LTIVPAMFGRDAYWAVSHIDDGEIGRAASKSAAEEIALAYVSPRPGD
jgi:hypothetical protein